MLQFGVTAAQFHANYFEKNAYLRRRALCEPAIDWPQLNEMLYRIEPREPAVALFRQGPVAAEFYTETCTEFGMPRIRFNRSRFYDQLAKGATLVINRIENHLLAARRLCAEVCRFSGQQAIGNAYLGLRGGGTFGKHWDTHDVFAIQLLGRKRWQVFAPTLALPLSHQRSDGREGECPSTPALDCVLETGDLLYMPRGWWHQTIPLDCASFHISVGTYAPTIYDFVMWCAVRHLPGDSTARSALASNISSQQLARTAQELMNAILEPRAMAEFAQAMQARERLPAEFNLDLFLNPGDAELPADAIIAMNGNCYVVGDGEILVNGARSRIDATAETILAIVNAQSPLPLNSLRRQLPGLAPESLRSAVVELVRRDVVTVLP